MSDPVIALEMLTKYYGRQRGVLDLTLEVQAGEIFGFLGPNGAGKTTTIRLLLDFLRPTRGQARIFGLDARRQSATIHSRCGYLPGELTFYEAMTGQELLRYFAALRGKIDWTYVQQLTERFEVDLKRPIRTLSRGNKQKVGLLQALMHRPELLILDEPTNGLDPLMQVAFYQLLQELRAAGVTVFFSSHNLPEVERICDRVAIIREGRLIAVESISALKQRSLRHVTIEFGAAVPSAAFNTLPGVREVKLEGNRLSCTVSGSPEALLKAAAQFPIQDLLSYEASLEDIFLAYYNGGNEHVA